MFKRNASVFRTRPIDKYSQKAFFHASRCSNLEMMDVLGPVHSSLQAVHTYTGLPWYMVIPLSTIFLRSTITLPLSISNRLRARKQAELQPLLSAMLPVLRTKLAASQAAQAGKLTIEQIHVLSMKERRNRRVELFRKFKCQSWKSLVLLPMVQIPLWATMSLVIRSMCGWQVIEGIPKEWALEDEKFLWLSDLLTPDPYGFLSVLIGSVALANVEWNALMAMNPTAVANQKPGKVNIPSIFSNLSRLATLMFMTASFQAPAAVGIYWLSSNIFSLVQNLMLDVFLPIRYLPKPPSQINSDILQLKSTESTANL